MMRQKVPACDADVRKKVTKKHGSDDLVAQVMKKYDKSKSGDLTMDELGDLLTDLNGGRRPSPDEIKWLLHAADKSRTGTILIAEIRPAIHEYLIYLHNRPHIEKIYQKYDVSKTGSLDREEFRSVLFQLNQQLPIADEELDWVLEHANLVNPGQVTKFEYLSAVDLWRKHSAKNQSLWCSIL
eukprot:c20784_g1_i1.p1 GENE.c20784_g1_i1~~c20784_g1_i1.p1  ORF type:complete len:183 (-),score=38.06 c20784_g1_i1:446-994(-)